MYDLVIVGGGPAGLTAAIYAVRYKLNAVVIAKEVGGIIAETSAVENYPGFSSVSGLGLAKKFEEHAKALGVKVVVAEVADIARGRDSFVVTADKRYECRAIILALGTRRRKLNIPGEAEFIGKGVAYCATCDAPFFKGRDVAVVGGSNAAAMAALLLAEHAKSVVLIYRGDALSADPVLVDRLRKSKKIDIMCCTNVTKINGRSFVEGIDLDNGKSLKVQGVFVEIGSVPSAAFTAKLGIKTDKDGYIVTGSGQETNVSGVFAAGDITTGSGGVRQVATAVGEATVAAFYAYKFVKNRLSKIGGVL